MTRFLPRYPRLATWTTILIFAVGIGLALSRSASSFAQSGPSESSTRSPTPLVIPDALGLPQPAATPPALGVATPPLFSLPQLLRQVEPTAEITRPSTPMPQVASIDFAGVWESQTTTLYGTVYSQMFLDRYGEYSMQSWWLDLLSYEVGFYVVGDGFIHFTVADYQPKIYKGKWMTRPTSWTAWYTVLDQDRMIWEDRTIGTRWTVRRGGTTAR